MRAILRRLRLREIGAFAWRYGVTAFLLFWCVFVIAAYLVTGDRPRPMSPPDGYVAEEPRVRLSWSPGGTGPAYDVLVGLGEDFSKPVFSRRVRGTAVVLPRLAPDTRYCWKVDGRKGDVSCFRTGPNALDL